ncbi:hypothetical protein CCYA_CCYA20G4765 [Cyanidiococcus yangmingshanensis]|nr:hypothetical protein CCYA_CCYA20G4765 [Cyanidiococcus yangmingshanensis]
MASEEDDVGFLSRLVQNVVTGGLLGTVLGTSLVYWHSYEQSPRAPQWLSKPHEGSTRIPFGFQGPLRRAKPSRTSSAAAAAASELVHPALQSPWRTVATHAGFLSSIGGLFVVGEYAARAVRGDKQDAWNSAVGGCLAGSAFGVRAGSLGTGVGICAVLGAFGAFADWMFTESDDAEDASKVPTFRHRIELAQSGDERTESTSQDEARHSIGQA